MYIGLKNVINLYYFFLVKRRLVFDLARSGSTDCVSAKYGRSSSCWPVNNKDIQLRHGGLTLQINTSSINSLELENACYGRPQSHCLTHVSTFPSTSTRAEVTSLQ